MRTRLIAIGNSRGIRIPKPLIEQAGLTDEVELRVRAGVIEVLTVAAPRAGWAEAAAELHADGGDELLDPPALTAFDESEWEW